MTQEREQDDSVPRQGTLVFSGLARVVSNMDVAVSEFAFTCIFRATGLVQIVPAVEGGALALSDV